MILKEEIEKIASVKAQELNGYIVDVTISSGNDIVVYFDKIGGVQIKECVTINRSINDYFDRDIEDYALTVCSPGLTNPFKIKAIIPIVMKISATLNVNQWKLSICKSIKSGTALKIILSYRLLIAPPIIRVKTVLS